MWQTHTRVPELEYGGEPEWPEHSQCRRNTKFGGSALPITCTTMHVLFWGLGLLLFPDLMNVVAFTGQTLLNSRKGKVWRFLSFHFFPLWTAVWLPGYSEWMTFFRISKAHDSQCFYRSLKLLNDQILTDIYSSHTYTHCLTPLEYYMIITSSLLSQYVIMICNFHRVFPTRLLINHAHWFSSPATVPEQLGTYEIVTPTRVNEAGDRFPTSLHFRRRKRSVDVSLDNASDQWASTRVHYKISAFGQSFHLNLTQIGRASCRERV